MAVFRSAKVRTFAERKATLPTGPAEAGTPTGTGTARLSGATGDTPDRLKPGLQLGPEQRGFRGTKGDNSIRSAHKLRPRGSVASPAKSPQARRARVSSAPGLPSGQAEAQEAAPERG